jgi:predicted ABC-type ATPase
MNLDLSFKISVDEFIASLTDNNRPTVLVLTGSNGAGKSMFYTTFLAQTNLPFVNADEIAKTLDSLAGQTADQKSLVAAEIADRTRRTHVNLRQSFIFETVFSDRQGDKVRFLNECLKAGYNVLIVFIGISNVHLSQARVIQRIKQGGHDVPDEKLFERFPRTLANLAAAIKEGFNILMLDNSSRDSPYRPIAIFKNSSLVWKTNEPTPAWAQTFLSDKNKQ